MDWIAETAQRTAADGDIPSRLPEVCPGTEARQRQAAPITDEVNPIDPEADNRAGLCRSGRCAQLWKDRPPDVRIEPHEPQPPGFAGLVGAERIELSTPCLKGRCSTTELHPRARL